MEWGDHIADAKPFEFIIEFEPYALQNKDELCFKSKSVQRIVRCKDCKHWVRNGTEFASCDLDALVRSACFFCANGEERLTYGRST